MIGLDAEDFKPRQTVRIRDFAGSIYNVQLFVPSRIGIMIAEMQDKLVALGKDGKTIDKDSMSLVFEIVSGILVKQYTQMTVEWIQDNLDFNDVMDLLNSFMGFHNKDMSKVAPEHLGSSETPEKNPYPIPTKTRKKRK